jgi:DNA-binding NarL/FixJ family response regulator
VPLLEAPPQSSRPRASVLIADNVEEWRAEVRKILGQQIELQIIAEACDGLEALQRSAELNPDLVLLDIGMPVLNGLRAAQQIQHISPQSRIVFLTQERDDEIRSAALDAGAHGYVLKANAASELLPTITAVLRNGHRANYVDTLYED